MIRDCGVFLDLMFDGYASRSLMASPLVTATMVSVERMSTHRGRPFMAGFSSLPSVIYLVTVPRGRGLRGVQVTRPKASGWRV